MVFCNIQVKDERPQREDSPSSFPPTYYGCGTDRNNQRCFTICITMYICISTAGSCGGRLETNVTYFGNSISFRQSKENAADCSVQCGQTDTCQYWRFLSFEDVSYCQLLSALKSKGPASGKEISGRRPCRDNGKSVLNLSTY